MACWPALSLPCGPWPPGAVPLPSACCASHLRPPYESAASFEKLQIHKEAADAGHSRQKAVAQRQAARAHTAEILQNPKPCCPSCPPAAGTQGQKDHSQISHSTLICMTADIHRITENYTQQKACAIVGLDGLIHSAQADHCSDGCAGCMDGSYPGPSVPNLD